MAWFILPIHSSSESSLVALFYYHLRAKNFSFLLPPLFYYHTLYRCFTRGTHSRKNTTSLHCIASLLLHHSSFIQQSIYITLVGEEVGSWNFHSHPTFFMGCSFVDKMKENYLCGKRRRMEKAKRPRATSQFPLKIYCWCGVVCNNTFKADFYEEEIDLWMRGRHRRACVCFLLKSVLIF